MYMENTQKEGEKKMVNRIKQLLIKEKELNKEDSDLFQVMVATYNNTEMALKILNIGVKDRALSTETIQKKSLTDVIPAEVVEILKIGMDKSEGIQRMKEYQKKIRGDSSE